MTIGSDTKIKTKYKSFEKPANYDYIEEKYVAFYTNYFKTTKSFNKKLEMVADSDDDDDNDKDNDSIKKQQKPNQNNTNKNDVPVKIVTSTQFEGSERDPQVLRPMSNSAKSATTSVLADTPSTTLDTVNIKRNRKLKIDIVKTSDTIFHNGQDKSADGKLYKNNFIYACNSVELFRAYAQKDIVLNIMGGLVVNPNEPYFKKHDDIRGNVIDFNSLYPSVMRWKNFCQTSTCYNPDYAIMVDGKLYNPFDEQVFDVIATPMKINTEYLLFLTFTTHEHVKQSVTNKIIKFLTDSRLSVKKDMKRAEAENDECLYSYCNAVQLALKLLSNANYGARVAQIFPIYRPLIGSLIPTMGRLSLIRLFLLYQKTVASKTLQDGKKRCVMGGDTDSLFVQCSVAEVKKLISDFQSIKINRGILNLEHEHVIDYALWLCRKNYILYTSQRKLVGKNVFTQQKSTESKSFLAEFLKVLFEDYFVYKDGVVADESGTTREQHLRECLKRAFKVYNEHGETANDGYYKHKFTLNKNLNEYLKKTGLFKQMEAIQSKDPGVRFERGRQIFYSHYNFIFTKGKYWGPLVRDLPCDDPDLNYNVTLAERKKFANDSENKNCTALIDEFIPYLSGLFSKYNIKISKTRSFELDLHSLIDKILFSLSFYSDDFERVFKDLFKETFGGEEYTTNRDSKSAQVARTLARKMAAQQKKEKVLQDRETRKRLVKSSNTKRQPASKKARIAETAIDISEADSEDDNEIDEEDGVSVVSKEKISQTAKSSNGRGRKRARAISPADICVKSSSPAQMVQTSLNNFFKKLKQ